MTDSLFNLLAAEKVLASEPGLARADHPDTSKEAAASIAVHAKTQRANLLRMLIALQRPATAEELELATGMRGNSVRPRLVELHAGHFVRKTGEQGVTRSGRKADLWEPTLIGRRAIAHIDNQAKAEK